jgi:hypothetical protein
MPMSRGRTIAVFVLFLGLSVLTSTRHCLATDLAGFTVARIHDPDHWTYLREKPGTSSRALARVDDLEAFWVLPSPDSQWWRVVLPRLQEPTISGFMHRSRVEVLKMPAVEPDHAIDDEDFIDYCHSFRRTPGDGGWWPGVVIALPIPSRFIDAVRLIEEKGVRYEIISSSGSGDHFCDYFYLRLAAPFFGENAVVQQLKGSGLFSFAARDTEGAGPDDLILHVRDDAAFTKGPDSREGANYVSRVLREVFANEKTVTVSDVVVVGEFDYRLSIEGSGGALASGNNALWERHKVQVTMGRMFDNRPGVFQMQLGFLESESAKGPRSEKPPPGRFQPMSDKGSVGDLMQKIASRFQTSPSGVVGVDCAACP